MVRITFQIPEQLLVFLKLSREKIGWRELVVPAVSIAASDVLLPAAQWHHPFAGVHC
jgi:hypothetical protein